MKKLIFIFAVTIIMLLSACGHKTETVVVAPAITDFVVTEDVKPFSNPANIEGSNYGSFFMAMFKTQNYDMALKFTSKGSVEKHGATNILKFYESFTRNYSLVQESILTKADTITIKYTTTEVATGKFKTIKVVLENDSCKIVLPDNLSEFLK